MSAPASPETATTRVFSPRTVLILILAGVFSFSAYFVLSAYAPDLRSGDDGGAHALSKSAVGYAGLLRLLNATGTPAAASRTDPKAFRGPVGLVVLTPPPTTAAETLDDAAGRAPITLVVLPKWQTLPSQINTGWVQAAGPIAPELLTPMLAKRFGKVSIARRSDDAPAALVPAAAPGLAAATTGPIDQLQTITAPRLAPILVDAHGGVVLARAANDVFLLSDPDLLNTKGMKSLKTARFAVGLVNGLRAGQALDIQAQSNPRRAKLAVFLAGHEPVLFDVTLDGYARGQSLLKLAFEPPFLAATLCLAATALLMGLHAASRFGAPRESGRALALGKEALAESSAGLIRMARREPHMAAGYLELCRAQVAKALGADRLTGADLDAYLDRQGERVGAGRLTEIAAETRHSKDRAGLLAAAVRLYRWRLEMTRERN